MREVPIDQCYASVDGTDCPILEPFPRSPTWYSHKLNCASLRYEIAVSIQLAKIVAVSGPWPAGTYSDLKIFRQGLKSSLGSDEFVIADRGYPDSRCLQPPGHCHPKHVIYQKVRARHEVVNKRLKQFKILTTKCRNDLSFHGTCFFAIANVTVLLFHHNPMFGIS